MSDTLSSWAEQADALAPIARHETGDARPAAFAFAWLPVPFTSTRSARHAGYCLPRQASRSFRAWVLWRAHWPCVCSPRQMRGRLADKFRRPSYDGLMPSLVTLSPNLSWLCQVSVSGPRKSLKPKEASNSPSSGVILRRDGALGQRVEERGLAHVGQSHDAAFEAHGRWCEGKGRIVGGPSWHASHSASGRNLGLLGLVTFAHLCAPCRIPPCSSPS